MRGVIALGVLAGLVDGAAGFAQAPADFDHVERAMAFVDRSTEATALLNSNEPEAALAIFEAVEADSADLDEDGYVAIAIGDCLVALGREAEARDAYRHVAADLPELAEKMTYRLAELELAGEPSDALIEELRLAAQVDDPSRYTATWQLGRALQKRVGAFLAEAAATFRIMGEADSVSRCRGSMIDHATTLQELADELERLVQRMESKLSLPGRPRVRDLSDLDLESSEQVRTERLRSRRVIRLRDERRIEFETTAEDADGEARVTANGRPIELTERQALLIKRYNDRINAILLEAADSAG